MLPIKFQNNRPFVSGEEAKIDFQDGGHGSHIGFPIRTILAIFYLQATRCFLPSFMSIGLLVQKKKLKVDCKHGVHLGFLIGTILAIFDVQVTPMLPIKFQVNWLFGAKYRFSRWQPWRPSWISDQNNFSYF